MSEGSSPPLHLGDVDRIAMRLLVFFLAAPLLVVGQQQSFFGGRCAPPSNPNSFEVPNGACSPSTGGTVTEDDLAVRAVDYAPVIYFHPLEKYFLSDASEYARGPGIVQNQAAERPGATRRNLTAQDMYIVSREPEFFPNAASWFAEHNRTLNEDFRAGATFDRDGKTTAPIYYNAFDLDENIWVINYFFYYNHNGCSNQVATIVSPNATEVTNIPYIARSVGELQGDWESISVMACKSMAVEAAPHALAHVYRAHGFNQIFDCRREECQTTNKSQHPAVFSGLLSHASYQVGSSAIPYATIPAPLVYNFQGLFLVDRTTTLSDPTKGTKFVMRSM